MHNITFLDLTNFVSHNVFPQENEELQLSHSFLYASCASL